MSFSHYTPHRSNYQLPNLVNYVMFRYDIFTRSCLLTLLVLIIGSLSVKVVLITWWLLFAWSVVLIFYSAAILALMSLIILLRNGQVLYNTILTVLSEVRKTALVTVKSKIFRTILTLTLTLLGFVVIVNKHKQTWIHQLKLYRYILQLFLQCGCEFINSHIDPRT